MSYGMQIRTPNGLESIENLRSLREVFRVASTTTSGSVSVPNGANESNSAVFLEIKDGGQMVGFSWSGSTLSWIAWGNLTNPSTDFDIVVCRFK